MKFLLDTNICIYALRQAEPILSNLLSRRPSDLGVSVITEAELRVGAAKSNSPKKTLSKVEAFLSPLGIMGFESEDAATYGRVRAHLEKSGRPIGPLDTLIAAQAVGRDLVLVTNNEREFRRVPKLRIENWT